MITKAECAIQSSMGEKEIAELFQGEKKTNQTEAVLLTFIYGYALRVDLLSTRHLGYGRSILLLVELTGALLAVLASDHWFSTSLML